MAIQGQRTMSKTQHYRKVTKPLLERKRRARMNRYLDELKELIMETMESQDDHITKLEKADILELTVTYLRSKKRQHPESHHENPLNVDRFREGYSQAAYEVQKVFASVPGINSQFGAKVMRYLSNQINTLQQPGKDNFNDQQIKARNCTPENRKDLDHDHDDQQQQNEEKIKNLWRPW